MNDEVAARASEPAPDTQSLDASYIRAKVKFDKHQRIGIAESEWNAAHPFLLRFAQWPVVGRRIRRARRRYVYSVEPELLL